MAAKRRQKTPEPSPQHQRVVDELAKGKPFPDAMRAAGYAESTVRLGPKATLARTPALREAIKSQLNVIDPTVDESLIVGTIRDCMKNGERLPGRLAAAKLLGQHRKLNLWQPEVQVGIVLNNIPADFESDLEN